MATIDDILKKKDTVVAGRPPVTNVERAYLNSVRNQPSVAQQGQALPQTESTPSSAAQEQPQGVENGRAMTYSQMYDALNPMPSGEELERMKKRDKSRRIIGAIGDGLSAIANMYYVGKGAPSARLTSMSGQYGKMYDDAVAKYKESVDAWRKGKWDAYVRDVLQGNKDREYELGRSKADDANQRAKEALEYKREKDKADAEYRKGKDDSDREYKQAVLDEKRRSNAALQKYRQDNLKQKDDLAKAKEAREAGKRATGTIQLYDRNGAAYPVYEKDWRNFVPQLVDMIERETDTNLDLSARTGIGVSDLDKQIAYVNEHWADVPEAVEAVKNLAKQAGWKGDIGLPEPQDAPQTFEI